MILALRFLGAAIFAVWTIVVLSDLRSIAIGAMETTMLANLIKAAPILGHSEWLAFAMWLVPGIIGAFCMLVPMNSRRLHS